jgi:hypothetical protein
MNLAIRLGLAVLLVAATAGPSPSAQTARTKQVMHTKLDHSQRILEAVVTSNWQLLDREARGMAAVTRDPAWDPAYASTTTVLVMPAVGRRQRPLSSAPRN